MKVRSSARTTLQDQYWPWPGTAVPSGASFRAGAPLPLPEQQAEAVSAWVLSLTRTHRRHSVLAFCAESEPAPLRMNRNVWPLRASSQLSDGAAGFPETMVWIQLSPATVAYLGPVGHCAGQAQNTG